MNVIGRRVNSVPAQVPHARRSKTQIEAVCPQDRYLLPQSMAIGDTSPASSRSSDIALSQVRTHKAAETQRFKI